VRVALPGLDERPAFLDALRARLPAGVALVDGDAEILVKGVPEEQDFAARPSLRAVVIPYAGVPPRTRERVAAREGITLHNLHHNAAPTAEMALALLLATAKSVVPFDRALRANDWRGRYAASDELLLDGARALVLGYGAIGRRVARGCDGLGMDVRIVRRRPRGDEEFACVDLDEALPEANALLIALPSTPETDGLLDAKRLARLPANCCLVNVGRGAIVDEDALYEELRSGRIRAGLDVWWTYPGDAEARADTAPSRRDFAALDNVVMSPHRAGHCAGIERLRAEHLADLLERAARGEPIPNRVDLEAGY